MTVGIAFLLCCSSTKSEGSVLLDLSHSAGHLLLKCHAPNKPGAVQGDACLGTREAKLIYSCLMRSLAGAGKPVLGQATVWRSVQPAAGGSAKLFWHAGVAP